MSKKPDQKPKKDNRDKNKSSSRYPSPDKEAPKNVLWKQDTVRNVSSPSETLQQLIGTSLSKQVELTSDTLNKPSLRKSLNVTEAKPEDVQFLMKQEVRRLEMARCNYLKNIFDVPEISPLSCEISLPTDLPVWENVPEVVIKLFAHISGQSHATAEHLYQKSLEETCAQLRKFTETELNIINTERKQAHEWNITQVARIDQFAEAENKKFYEVKDLLKKNFQEWTEKMCHATISDLLTGVTDEMAQCDQDEMGTTKVKYEPVNAKQSRMFTLEQLRSLFNYQLRHSNVRSRVDRNQQIQKDLLQRVEQLEAWRLKLEDKFHQTQAKQDKRLDDLEFNWITHSDEYKEFKKKQAHQFLQNDSTNSKHFKRFEELANHLDAVERRIDQTNDLIHKKSEDTEQYVAEQVDKVQDDLDRIDDKTTYKTEACLAEIQKTRIELTNDVNIRIDMIENSVMAKIGPVQKSYIEAQKIADNQVAHLEELFKEKMVKIKGKCATFFAKIETSNEDVAKTLGQLSKVVSNLEKNYATDPIQAQKAKLFTLQTEMEQTQQVAQQQLDGLWKVNAQLVTALHERAQDQRQQVNNLQTENSKKFLNNNPSYQALLPATPNSLAVDSVSPGRLPDIQSRQTIQDNQGENGQFYNTSSQDQLSRIDLRESIQSKKGEKSFNLYANRLKHISKRLGLMSQISKNNMNIFDCNSPNVKSPIIKSSVNSARNTGGRVKSEAPMAGARKGMASVAHLNTLQSPDGLRSLITDQVAIQTPNGRYPGLSPQVRNSQNSSVKQSGLQTIEVGRVLEHDQSFSLISSQSKDSTAEQVQKSAAHLVMRKNLVIHSGEGKNMLTKVTKGRATNSAIQSSQMVISPRNHQISSNFDMNSFHKAQVANKLQSPMQAGHVQQSIESAPNSPINDSRKNILNKDMALIRLTNTTHGIMHTDTKGILNNNHKYRVELNLQDQQARKSMMDPKKEAMLNTVRTPQNNEDESAGQLSTLKQHKWAVVAPELDIQNFQTEIVEPVKHEILKSDGTTRILNVEKSETPKYVKNVRKETDQQVMNSESTVASKKKEYQKQVQVKRESIRGSSKD